jgi:hypothetical protein
LPETPLENLLDKGPRPTPSDETIASLEAKNEQLRNECLEQRFLWVLITLVLFDAMIFQHIANWAAPLVIGVIEIVGIYVMAARCQVDTVAPMIDRLTGYIAKVASKDRGGD